MGRRNKSCSKDFHQQAYRGFFWTPSNVIFLNYANSATARENTSLSDIEIYCCRSRDCVMLSHVFSNIRAGFADF